MQDLTRIDTPPSKGEFASNAVLRDALHDAERVHLIGLVSDGGVHSSLDHLQALIELGGARSGVPDLMVHAFTEAATRTPSRAPGYLEQVEDGWREPGWDGSARSSGATTPWTATSAGTGSSCAYDLLVHGRGPSIAPTRRRGRARRLRARRDRRVHHADARRGGGPDPPRDSVFGFNFRPDRMREITRALAEPGFGEIDRHGGAPWSATRR